MGQHLLLFHHPIVDYAFEVAIIHETFAPNGILNIDSGRKLTWQVAQYISSHSHGPQLANRISRSAVLTIPSSLKSGGPPGFVPHSPNSESRSAVLTVLSLLRSQGHGITRNFCTRWLLESATYTNPSPLALIA